MSKKPISHSPVTPDFTLRFERLGWTRVPVKLLCDGHPVGSCASSASTGADETSHALAGRTRICTKTASGSLSVLI